MPQMARWLSFIEEFDYEVQHRAGRQHGNVDGLSQRPESRDAEDGDSTSDDTDGQTESIVRGEVAALVKESGQGGEEPVEMTNSKDGSQSEWADLRQWQQSDPN